MKTLLLVRHSKSDWPEDIDDFDRPLTELGKINAPKMARFLQEKSIDIDTFKLVNKKQYLRPTNIIVT